MFSETYFIQQGRMVRKVMAAIDWMNEARAHAAPRK
jgi:hypothetical protein